MAHNPMGGLPMGGGRLGIFSPAMNLSSRITLYHWTGLNRADKRINYPFRRAKGGLRGVGWSVGWLGTYFRNNWYIRTFCMSGRTQGPPLRIPSSLAGEGEAAMRGALAISRRKSRIAGRSAKRYGPPSGLQFQS